jgi:putative aminopeptidase FrvX
MKSLIQKLVEIPGPSGYESQIRNAVRAEVEPLADEVRVDNLGNLIARYGQQHNDGIKIMLAAHIDEIGVIATHIDERGFVRFSTIGGVRSHTLPGGRVRFLDGHLGVIGVERPVNYYDNPGFDRMYIDLGVDSRDDSLIRVGDVAAFERPFIDLGKRLISKAMDDRIGVVVLIEALRKLREEAFETPNQIFFVFSVQEEVGVRGATAAAYGLNPDLGLAVDITPSGDTPQGMRMEVQLGKGPAIKVRDKGMLADPRIIDWMAETAGALKMPYQLEILEIGGTDARAIQLTRAGVPAGCLSIPCRYAHSPSEMVDYDDVQAAVKLLVALLKKPAILS